MKNQALNINKTGIFSGHAIPFVFRRVEKTKSDSKGLVKFLLSVGYFLTLIYSLTELLT